MTPWLYLSSCGPGTGQRAATSAASKPSDVGVGQVEPDVDQLHPSAVGQRVRRLEAAERDGQRGVHSRAADRAGRDVDPAGDVDGHHRDARASTAAKTSAASGRSGPEPEMPTTPSITRSVVALTLSTIRPPALTERGQAPLVGAFRLEQNRVGGSAAATQEGRGPQCVAAVVSGSDDRAHPPAGDSPVRAVNSATIAVANPYAARAIRAPSGRLASSGASASRIASAE